MIFWGILTNLLVPVNLASTALVSMVVPILSLGGKALVSAETQIYVSDCHTYPFRRK